MSEPMKSSMFTSSNLLIKFVAAAALVSGVAYTVYVSISDGNISSDEINTIFDKALQEDPELVTTLCEENSNESAAVQSFLQNNSDSSITVDNDVLDTVEDRCTEILVSTSTTDDTTPTSTTTTTYEDEGDNEDYDNEDYDNEDNDEYTVSVTPECDETLSKEYSNDPSQVTVTVVEATMNYLMGEEYPGILLCWEPMLVDNVEPEQYWVSFGYTLDEYIYNDSTYDTGIIFSVGTAGGYINFDGDEPLLTKFFFETEYFFYEPEVAEEFVKNGKLTIYFNIAAYNENTDSYYSDSTKTVSITINDPNG